MFLTPAVVILIIKSSNFLYAKSMTNIEQLKAQVPHLGCEKKNQSWNTDITLSGWGPRWVLNNDGNIIGSNVYKALVDGIHKSQSPWSTSYIA